MTNIEQQYSIKELHQAGLSLGLDIINLKMEIESLRQKLNESDLAKEIKSKEEILYQYQKNKELQENQLKEKMIEYGISNIEIDGWRLHIKESPGSLKVENEELLNEKYFRIKTVKEVDKMKIKEDLKNGEAIPGVEIVKTKSLEIKKINNER